MESSNQQAIREDLGVTSGFDVSEEAAKRITFLKNYLKSAGAKTYVLGISGGIDSATAGMLAQRAVAELREEGYDSKFIAMRLPYGTQADEAAAQLSISCINPDVVHTVNIKDSTDAMVLQVFGLGFSQTDPAQVDFVKGNIKARQRMIAQYAVAGATSGLVIGTDHAAEALMGFFTKFGDGACDLTPLTGLTKRRVRALGKFLGVPDEIVNKVPTADLEDLDPGKPDEVAYGLTYEQLDDFLEGKPTDEAVERAIFTQYVKTAHKRGLPVTPI